MPKSEELQTISLLIWNEYGAINGYSWDAPKGIVLSMLLYYFFYVSWFILDSLHYSKYPLRSQGRIGAQLRTRPSFHSLNTPHLPIHRKDLNYKGLNAEIQGLGFEIRLMDSPHVSLCRSGLLLPPFQAHLLSLASYRSMKLHSLLSQHVCSYQLVSFFA